MELLKGKHVRCAIPELSGIGGSYIFSQLEKRLNPEQVQKAQGTDLLSPSSNYSSLATAELGVCGLLWL